MARLHTHAICGALVPGLNHRWWRRKWMNVDITVWKFPDLYIGICRGVPEILDVSSAWYTKPRAITKLPALGVVNNFLQIPISPGYRIPVLSSILFCSEMNKNFNLMISQFMLVILTKRSSNKAVSGLAFRHMKLFQMYNESAQSRWARHKLIFCPNIWQDFQWETLLLSSSSCTNFNSRTGTWSNVTNLLRQSRRRVCGEKSQPLFQSAP